MFITRRVCCGAKELSFLNNCYCVILREYVNAYEDLVISRLGILGQYLGAFFGSYDVAQHSVIKTVMFVPSFI